MSVVPPGGFGPIDKSRHWADSHQKRFGTAVPSFPMTLERARRKPHDQSSTNFCTEYGETTSGGYEHDQDFSPEWETAAACAYLGAPIMDGADPYPSMQVPTVMGYLPIGLSPFTLARNGAAFIAQWTNWPKKLAPVAAAYAADLVPYYVDGPYDTFDNVRNALYQAFLANEKGVVKAFGFWYASWNTQAGDRTQKGRVRCPSRSEQPVSRHRYTFIDFDADANGEPVLVAALTQGEEFGDGGFLYFDRATINQVFENSISNGLGLYIARPRKDNFAAAIMWIRSIFAYLASRVNLIKPQAA